MYFATISSSTNLIIYKRLLDKYLEDKKHEDVKDLFEKIILTTHRWAKKEITESEIDHKFYDLVTLLIDENTKFIHDYFLKIDPNNISIENFQTLSNIMTTMISEEKIEK